MSNPAPIASDHSPEEALSALGITLPEGGKTVPGAAYVPYTVSGNQVLVSGQLPFVDGAISTTGQLGAAVSIEAGQDTARTCAINVLAQLQHACGGDLSRVKRLLRIEILVSSTPDFTEPHVVANGASELFLSVLGEARGAHARVAYGVASLPMNAAVEVAAVAEI